MMYETNACYKAQRVFGSRVNESSIAMVKID